MSHTLDEQQVRERPVAATTPFAALVNRAFELSTFVLIGVIPVENALTLGPVALARLVAAGTTALFVLAVLTGRRVVVDRLAGLCVLALVGWAVASYFWSYAPQDTLVYASTFVQLGVLTLLVWQVCTTAARLRLAFVSLAVGGSVGSLMAVLETVSRQAGVARYSIGDPNDFGIFVCLTLMATVHLAATGRGTRWTLVWCLLAGLQALAILRTASRTAAVAAAVGLLLLACDRRILRLRVLLAVTGTIALLVILTTRLTSTSAIDRVGSVFQAASTGDFNHRTEFWARALSYWSSSPLAGIGGGAYRARASFEGRGTAVHSVPVGVLTELGVVGLVLLGVAVLVALARVLQAPDTAVVRVMLAMWACWLIGSLTLTLENRKITWLLLALATCRGISELRARRAARGTA
jgi:O-antigen ligase